MINQFKKYYNNTMALRIIFSLDIWHGTGIKGRHVCHGKWSTNQSAGT